VTASAEESEGGGAWSAAVPAAVASYLRARFGGEAAALRVAPLAGDASTRRYFRVAAPNGESWIAALHAEGFAEADSSFLSVQKLLAAWRLPVPQVLGCDGALGVVLLEDLGDCTLEQRLAVAAASEREALYREALDQTVRMQRAAAAADAGAACFGLAFDAEKLGSELGFFVDHFLQGYLGCALGTDERAELTRGFDELCREIASWPRVLCHRDYHSRNLMWQDGHLRWIDFQDARMGPATYDVASLLRDSYVDLDEQFVAARLREYRSTVSREEDAGSFERRFELTCIQRNLKALGTFGYQAAMRGRKQYLSSVPRTLAHVKRNLARHPSLAGVARTLARHIEGL
jgi:N-acetylmuramate 1-kinase